MKNGRTQEEEIEAKAPNRQNNTFVEMRASKKINVDTSKTTNYYLY